MHPGIWVAFGELDGDDFYATKIFYATKVEWFTRNLSQGPTSGPGLSHSHNASRINEPMEAWSVLRTSVA